MTAFSFYIETGFHISVNLKNNFMNLPPFTVYVLYSLKDQDWYVGYTTNFNRRMNEHENGQSKSTACRRPFICIYCEFHINKTDAMRREMYLKTWAGRNALKLMLRESLMELPFS
jgi:putative endonuclease